jgi:hypothetical protein
VLKIFFFFFFFRNKVKLSKKTSHSFIEQKKKKEKKGMEWVQLYLRSHALSIRLIHEYMAFSGWSYHPLTLSQTLSCRMPIVPLSSIALRAPPTRGHVYQTQQLRQKRALMAPIDRRRWSTKQTH